MAAYVAQDKVVDEAELRLARAPSGMDQDHIDTKDSLHQIDHLDKQDADITVPVSAFAHLDFKQTLRLFWKSFMYAMMALFLACSDGFQFQLPGNLIAQTSFIRESPL